MTCDCSNQSTKAYASALPGGQVEMAQVTITSACEKAETPEEYVVSTTDRTGQKHAYVEDARTNLLSAVAFGKRTGFDLAVRKPSNENEGDDGDDDCVTSYIIQLANTTTAGFMISQVQLGDQTFGVAIGVGQRQIFTINCDECCITSRNASVTIVDQNGAFKAKLARFKICECVGAV